MGEQEKEIEELLKEEQQKEGEMLKDLAEGHSRRQEILKSISKKIKGKYCRMHLKPSRLNIILA